MKNLMIVVATALVDLASSAQQSAAREHLFLKMQPSGRSSRFGTEPVIM